MASGTSIPERMEKGYNFITVANDINLLKKGANDLMKELGLK
jgi:hypothetical protein